MPSEKVESADETSLNKFEIIEKYIPNEFVKSRGVFNIYKHMLMQKKVTHSSINNFLLMIYFLYYRISLNLGIIDLTMTESVIVNIILCLILYSMINQVSWFMFRFVKHTLVFVSEIWWIYSNIDEIRRNMK